MITGRKGQNKLCHLVISGGGEQLAKEIQTLMPTALCLSSLKVRKLVFKLTLI